MHLRCSLATAAVAVALSSSLAHAEEEWYGYQVAAPDVVGWVVAYAGAQSDAWPVTALGFGGMLLGGPIVHAAHDNWGRAGISLGLRVGAPLAGVGLGLALGGGIRKGGLHAIAYAIVGASIGYIAAAMFDVGYLARVDVPEAAPRMFSIGGRF
jgi:hypothetical protein